MASFFVDCLSSVWRSAVDARNGQNRKQQLLNPHDIVLCFQQHFTVSKHAVMSAFAFDSLSAYELAEYRDHDLFKGALGECVGISVAHCFTQQKACGAEPQDAEVHMQGLSDYGKPDACSQQSFELFLRCGFPPVAGRRCTTSWSTCKPLDGSAVQHAAGGAAPLQTMRLAQQIQACGSPTGTATLKVTALLTVRRT